MSVIVCKMPKAGLGNQLFPLMKAVVLHRLTSIPLIVTNDQQFFPGTYLRGEKSKRRYNNYFTFQKNIFFGVFKTTKLLFYNRYKSVKEPSLKKAGSYTDKKSMFIYSDISEWNDYFFELRDFRDIVVSSFYGLLQPWIMQRVRLLEPPCIGVHIRMGDFRQLKNGEDFSKVGLVRTPEFYFVAMIKQIREIAGKELPVTVFTDGYLDEFNELFHLPAVVMAEGNPDITDMILLSKSKIIVCSAGSTFSYWAAFLSEAALILHPDHIHKTIRPASMMNKFYEGPFDRVSSLLIKNIKSIYE